MTDGAAGPGLDEVEDGRLFDLLDEAATLIDEGRVAPSESMKCVYREVIHEAIRRLRAALREPPPQEELATSIVTAAIRLGITSETTPFTGPEVLLLLQDIEEKASVSALREPPPQEQSQLGKVREYLIRLSKGVVRPGEYGIQVLRRDRENGDIEYQVFADTKGNGRQIAWVQSSRHDADFIAACLAQAALFPKLFSVLREPPEAKQVCGSSCEQSDDCDRACVRPIDHQGRCECKNHTDQVEPPEAQDGQVTFATMTAVDGPPALAAPGTPFYGIELEAFAEAPATCSCRDNFANPEPIDCPVHGAAGRPPDGLFRSHVQALVEKLDVILPIVDGYIVLQHVRSGGQYRGPNLVEELKAVKADLAAGRSSLPEGQKGQK